MASTYGLSFSQHGVWVLRDSVLRAKVPRSRRKKLLILLKAKSQTSTACFCYQPRFKNRRSKVYLSVGIVTKNLPSSLINCIPNVLSKYLPKLPLGDPKYIKSISISKICLVLCLCSEKVHPSP